MKPSFGKLPRGKRQERIEQSPNYRAGSFRNLAPTSMLVKGASYFTIMREFIKDKPGRYPETPIPVVKTDLHTLSSGQPALIWFGHSSYLLVLEGKRILVDPVFSDRPSPVQFIGTKSFAGRVYSPNDFPDIDLLLLTHDHYDHLDYWSIVQLKSRVKKIFAPLGVGEHLEYWGVNPAIIYEFDWWEGAEALDDIHITATPARHFSGRGFIRNKTLWTSYLLQTRNHKIFVGGDSGYDTVFATIGEKFGPFDLALLECGQYDKNWPQIHMMPEETVQAGIDLQARVMMPVHWGKFVLSNHAWRDPIDRAWQKAASLNVNLTTPRIGEPVVLTESMPKSRWWQSVR